MFPLTSRKQEEYFLVCLRVALVLFIPFRLLKKLYPFLSFKTTILLIVPGATLSQGNELLLQTADFLYRFSFTWKMLHQEKYPPQGEIYPEYVYLLVLLSVHVIAYGEDEKNMAHFL